MTRHLIVDLIFGRKLPANLHAFYYYHIHYTFVVLDFLRYLSFQSHSGESRIRTCMIGLLWKELSFTSFFRWNRTTSLLCVFDRCFSPHQLTWIMYYATSPLTTFYQSYFLYASSNSAISPIILHCKYNYCFYTIKIICQLFSVI